MEINISIFQMISGSVRQNYLHPWLSTLISGPIGPDTQSWNTGIGRDIKDDLIQPPT